MGVVDAVKVSEVFGPTLQGEGPNAGRPAAFLRLGGCNLQCTWCDTPWTWDASRYDLRVELADRTTDDLAAQLLAMGVDRLVVTGGEPLLQQRWLTDLLTEVAHAMPHVEVETNGTRTPEDELLPLVSQWNVSPKLAHAGQGAKALNAPALRALQRTGRAVWKFVVQTPRDLAEVDLIVRQHGLRDVWLMPLGTDADTLTGQLGWLCDAAIQRGWSVTPRLHVLAWGDTRGR